MADTTEWAGNVWDNIEKHRKDQSLKDEAFVLKVKRIKHDAKPLWLETRTAMEEMSQALNKEAGKDVLLWDSERSFQALISHRSDLSHIQRPLRPRDPAY